MKPSFIWSHYVQFNLFAWLKIPISPLFQPFQLPFICLSFPSAVFSLSSPYLPFFDQAPTTPLSSSMHHTTTVITFPVIARANPTLQFPFIVDRSWERRKNHSTLFPFHHASSFLAVFGVVKLLPVLGFFSWSLVFRCRRACVALRGSKGSIFLKGLLNPNYIVAIVWSWVD